MFEERRLGPRQETEEDRANRMCQVDALVAAVKRQLAEQESRMSWSVSAIGKPPAVAVSIEEQFSRYKCIEPEEGVRQGARATLAAALAAQRPDSVVKVSASGSQSSNTIDGVVLFTNVLSITVEPQYGFVE
jgi:hypothetical protein